MNREYIAGLAKRNGIHFIPHHKCGICGQTVGWDVYRWFPYEVVFNATCGCTSYVDLRKSSWEEIAAWVCDKDGGLRKEYKALFNQTGDE